MKIFTELAKLMLLRRCVITRCSESVMTQLRQGALRTQQRYATRTRDWKIAWRPTLVRQSKAFLPSTVTMLNRLGLCAQGLGTKKEFKKRAKCELLRIFKNENL